MEETRNFTIYLDQNIISHLREGQPASEELLSALKKFQKCGAIIVYSNIHVEECRAFHEPEQFVGVLDAIDGHYIQPSERLGLQFEIRPNIAKDLLLSEADFAGKSLALLSNQMLLSQYALAWLGELEAEDLKQELEADIDLWIEEFERETLGLVDSSSIRQQLLDSLHSLDLDKLKHQGLELQPLSAQEWNARYSRIDQLASDEVAEFILSELGDQAAQHLSGMFPKKIWPNGTYQESGTLTGLTFFLFTQGVGRDRGVKSGSQSNRRKRFQAQFRDCQHIEEAARCGLFLSNDAGAIQLAKAAYAYAGVKTSVKHVFINLED